MSDLMFTELMKYLSTPLSGKFSKIYVVLGAIMMCEYAFAHDVYVSGIKINYDDLLTPRCGLILRHGMSGYKAGYVSRSDLCQKYQVSKSDETIDSLPAMDGEASIITRKKDYISMDELQPWKGTTPIRARFDIGPVHDDPDPDLAPSYLPYDKKNKVKNYMLFDKAGYEVSLRDGKKTGYRFYEFMGRCYLATEHKPRVFKYVVECNRKPNLYQNFPKTLDTSSHLWINVMDQNTVDLGERMLADSVEILGAMPVKPLIYSDHPIGDDGLVTQGRAMCMADCAPGMLMKLIRAGESIWGPSSKRPALVQQGKIPA
jgi:hypothetical protein